MSYSATSRIAPWARALAAAALAPVVGCALSTGEETGTAESAQTQASLAAFYERWETRAPSIVAEVTREYGSPLESMDEGAYAAFLGSLDLANDKGLMTWAAAAGVHVVALTRDSNFFYYNTHVLPANVGASLPYSVYSSYEYRFVPATGQLSFADAQGQALPSRTLLPDAIRHTESRSSLSYNAGFAEDRIHYATLSGYLAPLSAIPNRADIADAVRSMPLFMVKALRGKGFFLSTASGRSYTLAMPVGTDIYPLFAGLLPGNFFEANSPAQSRKTVVHEFCHVIDYSAVNDRFGSVLFPYRYPAIAALKQERDALFEPRPADTSAGFISAYSKTNAAEDFAEHCMAYARDRAAFDAQAQAETQRGSALLRQKFVFMERLFSRSAEFVRLSPAVVDALGVSSEGGGGGAGSAPTTCGSDPVCQETACLADLHEVSDIQAAVTQVLSVAATCATSSAPRPVANPTQSTEHYYVADLICTLASPPSPAAQRAFTGAMESRHFYGYALAPGTDPTPIVKAQASTRYCSSY